MLYYKISVCNTSDGYRYAIWNSLGGWKWKYDPHTQTSRQSLLCNPNNGKKKIPASNGNYQQIGMSPGETWTCRMLPRYFIALVGAIITEAGKSLLVNSKEILTISRYS